MKAPADDIEQRLPVWEAFGELFLDNEPDLDFVTRVCAASPYSLKELEQILFCETWPALWPNLVSVAGEWSGWDRDWLLAQVLAKHQQGSARFWWLNPLKRSLRAEWLYVRDAIGEKRLLAAPPHL